MMKWLVRGLLLIGLLIPVLAFLLPKIGSVDPRLAQAPAPLTRDQVARGQTFTPPAMNQVQQPVYQQPIQQGVAPAPATAQPIAPPPAVISPPVISQASALPTQPVAAQTAPIGQQQQASIAPQMSPQEPPQVAPVQGPAMQAAGLANIDPALLGTPFASTDPIIQCLVRDPPPEIHPLRVSQWTPALPQMVLLPNVRFGLDEFNGNGDMHSVLDAQISNLIVGQPMRNSCSFLGIELVNARVGAKLPNGEVLVETVHVWRHRDGARACAEQTVRYTMTEEAKAGHFKSHGALWKAEQAYATGVVLQESGGLAYGQGDPVRCAAAMGDIKIAE